MSKFDDTPRDDDSDEEHVKSRSQLKREMSELQKLGVKLVELSDKHLIKIPLEGQLEAAIQEARRIRHREGRRRQLQFIGKLMRSADTEAIQAAYDRVMSIGQENTKTQQMAERWRDRLLGDDKSALQKFLEDHPNTDVQHLRQLIRNTQKEISQQKPPAAARKLFRYLREQLEEN